MPDWRKFVRERLGTLGLRPEREEEIRAELAEHLEDQGEVDGTDWALLAREIRHAEEGTMSPTAKTLWVPGVSMLVCSFVVLLVINRLWVPNIFVKGHQVSPWDPSLPVMLLTLWVLAYLLLGALGAGWSRRAGGGPRVRFLAGTFPVTMHLAIFILPLLAALTPGVPGFPADLQADSLLRHALLWVLIPAGALAIGTIPFLRDAARSR